MTMAGLVVSSTSINYFDLENPLSMARLGKSMTALQDLRDLVIIDESNAVQSVSDIASIGRPHPAAGTFSDFWQRFTGPTTAVIGIIGWADFDHHHERF
jgi:hypothetical protein